jgi:hypothetical protein
MEGDHFRSHPVRYLGYLHGWGTALPVSAVSGMWMSRITMGYIACDVFSQATDKRMHNFLSKAVDAALWQGVTSWWLPVLVTQGAAHLAHNVNNGFRVKAPTNRYVQFGFVLVSLPLVGGFIDRYTTFVFDYTIRNILFG